MSLIIAIAVFAAIVFLFRKDYIFLDFQIQVSSFIWGKRFGVKRKPRQPSPLEKVWDNEEDAAYDKE